MSPGRVPRRNGPRRWLRRTLFGTAAFVLVVVAAAAGYVGYVMVRRDRPVALPPPTGPYKLGRATFEWTDARRVDPFAPTSGTPRGLSVWVWYPAPSDATGKPADYAPGPWSELHFQGLLGVLEGPFDTLRTNALSSVPVAPGRFPIVVLEPGMGLSAPMYASLAEDLASHGYLVAGVTPTYSANHTVLHGKVIGSTRAANPEELGDGSRKSAEEGDRLIDVWAADARFVARTLAGLDHVGAEPARSGPAGLFVGRIAHTPVSYVGHSFGGASSLQACHDDPRCAGAVDLDGTEFGDVVRTGLRAPLMILQSEDSCVTGACGPAATDNPDDGARARSLLAASTTGTWCYTIEGARHFNFTDYGAFYVAEPLRSLLALGSIDGRRALAVQNAYVVAFVEHVTHDSPQPLLRGPSPYPEVREQCTSG